MVNIRSIFTIIIGMSPHSIKKLRLSLGIIMIGLFHATSAWAQYNETIRADRPGAAIVPFAVGSHVLQLQGGLSYSEYTVSESYPSFGKDGGGDLTIRYGLTESFELNSSFGHTIVREGNDSTSNTYGGVNLWDIGFRYNIFSGENWVPSVGIQTSFGLPWLDSDFSTEYVRPKIILIAALNMSSTLTLTTNMGLEWDGNMANPLGYYVFNFSFAASNKLSLFLEAYGYVDDGTWYPYFNAGAGYLLNNNLQIDLYTGIGTGPNELSDWLISAGVSWRVQFANN